MWLRKINFPQSWRKGRSDKDVFDALMTLEGKTFRNMPSRQTLQTALDGESVFIKKHFGVGWFEIFKNLVTLRRPVVDAGREWRVLQKLEQLGIKAPKALAYGVAGLNPAKRHSFVVLEDLVGMVSLETLAEDKCPALQSIRTRRRLIKALADIARRLHEHGINHRDFYLCHFLLPEGRFEHLDALHLIDLHRAEIRSAVPRRWRVKDLASLYFSAWPVELSNRDKLQFIKSYSGRPLKESYQKERPFWAAIDRRANKLYNEYMSKYA